MPKVDLSSDIMFRLLAFPFPLFNLRSPYRLSLSTTASPDPEHEARELLAKAVFWVGRVLENFGMDGSKK